MKHSIDGADTLLRHQSLLSSSTMEVSTLASQLLTANEERNGSLQRLSSILDDIRAKTVQKQKEETEILLQHLRSPAMNRSSLAATIEVNRRSTHASDFKPGRDMLDEAFETFQSAMDGGLSHLSHQNTFCPSARLAASAMKVKLIKALRRTCSPPSSPLPPGLFFTSSESTSAALNLSSSLTNSIQDLPSPEEVRLLRALDEAAQQREKAEMALQAPPPEMALLLAHPPEEVSPSHSPLWHASPLISPQTITSGYLEDVVPEKDQDQDEKCDQKCDLMTLHLDLKGSFKELDESSISQPLIRAQEEVQNISEAGSDLSLMRFVHASTSPILSGLFQENEKDLTPSGSGRVKRKARRGLLVQDALCNAWPAGAAGAGGAQEVADPRAVEIKCELIGHETQTDGTGSSCLSCGSLRSQLTLNMTLLATAVSELGAERHTSAGKDVEIAHLKQRLRNLVTHREEGQRQPRVTMSAFEDLLDEAEADLDSFHTRISQAAERQVELQGQSRLFAESISEGLRAKAQHDRMEAEGSVRLLSLRAAIEESQGELEQRQQDLVDIKPLMAQRKLELSQLDEEVLKKNADFMGASKQLDDLLIEIKALRENSVEALKKASEDDARASDVKQELGLILAELEVSKAALLESKESSLVAESRLTEIERLRDEADIQLASIASEVKRSEAAARDQADASRLEIKTLSNELDHLKVQLAAEISMLNKCQSACFDSECYQQELVASIKSLESERRRIEELKAELEPELAAKRASVTDATDKLQYAVLKVSIAKEELASIKSEVSKEAQRLEDLQQALIIQTSKTSALPTSQPLDALGIRLAEERALEAERIAEELSSRLAEVTHQRYTLGAGGRDGSAMEEGLVRGQRLRIEELESEAQEARQSTLRLRSKLSEAKDEIASLEDALHREQSSAARMKLQIASLDQALMHQGSVIGEDRGRRRSSSRVAADRGRAMEEEAEELRAEVKRLEVRQVESQSLASRLSAELSASNEKIEAADINLKRSEALARQLEEEGKMMGERMRASEDQSTQSSASFEVAMAESRRSQQLLRTMEEELERVRAQLRESREKAERSREEAEREYDARRRAESSLGSKVVEIEKDLAESEARVSEGLLTICSLREEAEGYRADRDWAVSRADEEKSAWKEVAAELQGKILALEEEALRQGELKTTCEMLKSIAARQESEMKDARDAAEARMQELEFKFMSLMERYSGAESEEAVVRSHLASLSAAIEAAEYRAAEMEASELTAKSHLEEMCQAIAEAQAALEEAEKSREAAAAGATEKMAALDQAKGDLAAVLVEEAMVRSRHEMMVEEAGEREAELAACLADAALGLDELNARVLELQDDELRLLEALRVARAEESETRSRTRRMLSHGQVAFDEVRGLCHKIDEASMTIDEMTATMILSDPHIDRAMDSMSMETQTTAAPLQEIGIQTKAASICDSESQTYVPTSTNASTQAFDDLLTVQLQDESAKLQAALEEITSLNKRIDILSYRPATAEAMTMTSFPQYVDCETETEGVEMVSRGNDAFDLSPPCADCSSLRSELVETEERISGLSQATAVASLREADLEQWLMEATLMDAELRERIHQEEGRRLHAETLIEALRQSLSDAEAQINLMEERMDHLDEESAALKKIKEARSGASTQTLQVEVASTSSQTRDTGSQVLENQLASFRRQIREQDEILQEEKIRLEDMRRLSQEASVNLEKTTREIESRSLSAQTFIRTEIDAEVEIQRKLILAIKSNVDSEISSLGDDRARIATDALEAKQVFRAAVNGLASCRAAHQILARINDEQSNLPPLLLDQLRQHFSVLEDVAGGTDGRSCSFLSRDKVQMIEDRVARAVSYARSKSASFEVLLLKYLEFHGKSNEEAAQAVKKGFEAFWHSSLKQFDRLEKGIQKLTAGRYPRLMVETPALLKLSQTSTNAAPIQFPLVNRELGFEPLVAAQSQESSDIELEDLLGVPTY